MTHHIPKISQCYSAVRGNYFTVGWIQSIKPTAIPDLIFQISWFPENPGDTNRGKVAIR